MGLISRIVGLDQLVEVIREEREHTRDLISSVLNLASRQTDANIRMAEIFDKMMKAYDHDGSPPEGRHINDELEARMFEKEISHG